MEVTSGKAWKKYVTFCIKLRVGSFQIFSGGTKFWNICIVWRAWPRHRVTKTDEIDFFVTETPPRYWVLWEPGMQSRTLLGGPSALLSFYVWDESEERKCHYEKRNQTLQYSPLYSPCNQFISWLESMRFTRRVPWLLNEVSTVCWNDTIYCLIVPRATSSAFLCHREITTTITTHLPSPIPILSILWINHRLWTRWLLNLRQKLQCSSHTLRW